MSTKLRVCERAMRQMKTGTRSPWRTEKRIDGAKSMGKGAPPMGDGNSCVGAEAIDEDEEEEEGKRQTEQTDEQADSV